MNPEHPFLSVIVPAHNGGAVLRQSLAALAQSDLPRDCWELIVVDDASNDDTPAVAARFADTVVRLPGRPHGPAYARNRGFEVCRGENVVFVDADVLVHRDTLRRFAEVFAREPDVSAVFGSYDNAPPARGIVSEYRNLLHHYVHHQNAGDAETFWAGCGAIRSSVFRQAGMYDEWHYSRPQIEDIELGNRIRALGHRIVLRPDIQGAHLKRWTLWQVIKTDLNDRGVPWTRLLMTKSQGMRTATLNLRIVEKVNTAFVLLAWLCVALAVLSGYAAWLLPAALWLLPVLVTNVRLYLFFARLRGLRFAVAVVPLNLLYYSLNIVSFAFGWLLHETVGAPRPDPTVEAYAEVGLESWPPVPAKRQVNA